MRITDGAGTPAIPPETQPSASRSAAPEPESSSSTKITPSSIVQHAFPYLSDAGNRVNLHGVAITSQTSASLNRNSGDFELARITTYNFVSRDTELTERQSSSLKVATASPSLSEESKREGENTEEDPNFFLSRTNLNLISAQGSANASLASATFSNRRVSLTVSALGVQASGDANLGVTHDGITAQASGNASAYLVDARAGLHAGPTQASADASVGAGVNGNAQVAFNPLKGDVGVNGGVGAFAGAQANETGSLSVDGTTASESANVGAGVGFEDKLDLGIDKGKIDVNLDVGAYLGVGAGVDVSFNVNVPQVADSAWHAITSFF
ncbi:MAG: hypothetical protein JO033_13950 [Acidobacteriaceae bacterium]|nr:hypothetical protein [Acidobacteriaceae bacterium]MBV9502822.1 hypothetical protein [Acidobacteriaceae bacterium]